MNEIVLEHLEKSFGDHKVLLDVNLTVNKGEVISVIGSSGSGKSTMLRCINLLEEPTGGVIRYKGDDILTLNLSKYRTQVGMVFQQFRQGHLSNMGNGHIGGVNTIDGHSDRGKKMRIIHLGILS